MTDDALVELIISKVRELATKYPDAIYDSGVMNGSAPGCYYDRGETKCGPPDAQGCIFGQVFQQINDKRINDLVLENNIQTVGSVFLSKFGQVAFKRERAWCGKVQREQDKKVTWSQAVEFADREHPLA